MRMLACYFASVRVAAGPEVPEGRLQVRVQAGLRVPVQRPRLVLRRPDDGGGVAQERGERSQQQVRAQSLSYQRDVTNYSDTVDAT